MLVATWAGIGALVLVNIIGWLAAYIRHARSEGKAIGRMEGKMDDMYTEVGGLKKDVADLSGRLGRIEGRLNGMRLAPKPRARRSPRRKE